jgi:hypothetical protein
MFTFVAILAKSQKIPYPTVRLFTILALPFTSRVYAGDAVHKPTLPPFFITK